MKKVWIVALFIIGVLAGKYYKYEKSYRKHESAKPYRKYQKRRYVQPRKEKYDKPIWKLKKQRLNENKYLKGETVEVVQSEKERQREEQRGKNRQEEKQQQKQQQSQSLSQSLQQQQKQQQCKMKPNYDYNILALRWPPQFCEESGECVKQWQLYWNEEDMLILGYWPVSSDPEYELCYGNIHTADKNCQHEAYEPQLDIDHFFFNETDMLEAIYQFWPPIVVYDQHQNMWSKHGVCFLANTIEDNPTAYKADQESFNHTILLQYFKSPIDKLKKLKILLESGAEYQTKEQLAAAIGFAGKEQHFIVKCGKDDQIDEINICYNRTKIPGKQVTTVCPFIQQSCFKNGLAIIK